jgi:hypothetical protein
VAECGGNEITPTGVARKATPGNAGKVMCSCVINGNKPIYKRRLQDQHLAISSGTIALLPQSVRDKLAYVPGLPGVFLTPKVEEYHNYIIADKKTSSNEDVESKAPSLETDNLNINKYEFYSPWAFTEDNKDVTVNGFKGTVNHARARHHLWLADGSIFSNFNATPSEIARGVSTISDFVPDLAAATPVPASPAQSGLTAAKIQMLFAPFWGYLKNNDSINSKATQGTTSHKMKPYSYKNHHGNVVSLINEAILTDPGGVAREFRPGDATTQDGKTVYTTFHNIAPGIHWRVVKKEPLFQGEDFSITFYRGATDNDTPSKLGNARFFLRKEFSPIDVYAYEVENSGTIQRSIINPILPFELSGDAVETAISALDFARQAYYIIELGVLGGGGGTPIKTTGGTRKQDVRARGDVNDHRYFIIIAENDQPKFVHVGRPYILNRKQEGGGSGEQPGGGSQGQDDCFPDSSSQGSQSPSETVTLEKPDHDIAVTLSTFPMSGKELMRQPVLQVMVRQHLGNLVIVFNGDFSNPWVIERQELTTKKIDPLKRDVLGVEDFEKLRVPMIIPAAPIAIMGGNRQAAFSFSPLKYNSVPDLPLRQNLSVLGPVNMDEINLLLRDKGYSKARKVGIDKMEFSQDAALYTEIIHGIKKPIAAMKVQEDLETRFGKAPDQQRSRPQGYKPHTIELSVRDCSARIGSEAPFVKTIQPIISLNAGSYVFQHPGAAPLGTTDPAEADNLNRYILDSCITPIMTGYRLNVPPYGTSFSASPVEVGHHVMGYSDNWTATDFQKIEHSGSISFLINKGMKFEDDQSDFLASLADKTFYIQVSIWWEGGIGSEPQSIKDRVVFTGLCHGGSITVENNKRVMHCEIHDYMKILKDQMILNSPFFDKMRDFNAVYEVMQLAGFRDGGGSDNTEPASLIRRLRDSQDAGWFALIHNGEKIFNQEYALPGSYDILQQPFLRFSESQHMYDAVEKMSSISGKMIYFDRLGVFHFEPVPDEQAFFNGQQQQSQEFSIIDYLNMAKIHFFASPREAETAAVHRQVFNAYTVKRNVEDVVNEIRIISNTPNGELLLAGHTNFDSIFEANTPGFIGYPKQFMQMEGIFGAESVVKGMVQHYTKMFIPPISISFEALGHNKIKALDIVSFQGLGDRYPQPLRVMSVKSEVDPSKNTWVQNFECEWIFSSETINWGDTSDIKFGIAGPNG